MNVENILFPTDFSVSSDAALDYASSLAAESGATLHIVHASDITPIYYAGYGAFSYEPELGKEMVHENELRLQKVKPTVASVSYEHHTLRGDAATRILEFVEREKVDLIVMGSHGRTGLSRLLMGSVAEEVVRKAKCPVLTVKQPEEKEASAAMAQASVK